MPVPSPRRGRAFTVALALLAACAGGEPPEAEAPGGAAPEVGAPAAADEAADVAPAAGGPDGGAPAAVTLVGLYVALDGRAVFTECATDRVLEVEPSEAAVALERAYRIEVSTPGAPLLAELAGRRVGDPPERVDVVSVHRLGDGPCPGARVDAPLEGTRWRVEALFGASVSEAVTAPWLRLDRERGRLDGFTGCRDLSGRYTWTGTLLRFGGLDPAPAMCPAEELHAAFMEAVRVTGSYRLSGDRLELMGEEGPVAVLRAAGG